MTTVAHATGPWHLVDAETSLRIHFSLPDGRQSGVAVSIGSTALSFRAPRQGNHRGERMIYRPFSDGDRANARLIAAAPELLAACKALVDLLNDDLDSDQCAAWDACVAAIAKAEGR